MAVDPRQIVGAFLTLSMFAMLGNMVKKDHFDSLEVTLPGASSGHFDVIKVEKVEDQGPDMDTIPSNGPWDKAGQELKPCWTKLSPKVEQSEGFITFSLMHGPEYHVSQVADAVVIARYLGATLVLPDIRGSRVGEKMSFQDLYDLTKFVKSLDGVVKISTNQPPEIAEGKLSVMKVHNRVTEDYITKNVEPIYKTKRHLRIVSSFSSANMKTMENQKGESHSVACLGMFGALELQPEIYEVVGLMMERLRTLGRKSGGRFIAVDLRLDLLDKKGCIGAEGRKTCYNAQEVGVFLRKVGFGDETTIYLTQTWWHESLNPLKALFPKTYTKEDIILAEKKQKFLQSGNSDLEKSLDFHICSQSDAFVPAISGLFYGNVAGRRIAFGKTQILVPKQVNSNSASASDFVSTYVTQKNHMAYSCYC
ncbi:Uncharacterized protein QJS10_CPA05g02399 [Acorus calamus]|uniref:O-fucosyltransferase family protein n=1 Tax=Acorus calamus TaxID=4465 RepID=A0AAV9ET83_ACOCL|nr:Uncharacterized protein QJS10_CPA05g02399 [Acorus calamus]